MIRFARCSALSSTLFALSVGLSVAGSLPGRPVPDPRSHLFPVGRPDPVEFSSCRGEANGWRRFDAAWPELADAESVITVASSGLLLRVENRTDAPSQVDVIGHLVADGLRSEQLDSVISVAPGQTVEVRLDPWQLGLPSSGLQFSAALYAETVHRDANGALRGRAYTPVVWTHMESAGSLIAYTQQAKLNQFNGGDFQGVVTPAVATDVLGIGSGGGGRGQFEDNGPTDLLPPPPSDGKWHFCFRWSYDFIDNDFGEFWYKADHLMKAHGIRYRIDNAAWGDGEELTGYADPDSGCVAFEADENTDYEITLYAKVRVGKLGKYTLTGHTKNGQQQTVAGSWVLVDDPGGNPRTLYYEAEPGALSNLMAAASFSTWWLDRNTTGLDGSASADLYDFPYDHPLCQEGCTINGSSLYFAGNPVTQEKFGVTHEIGHWFTREWIGTGTGINGMYNDQYNVTPDYWCEFSAQQGPGGHAMRSLEPGAAAFTEGTAHFLAALAWNNHHGTDGIFKYYKESITADSYQDMADDEWVVDLEGSGNAPVGGPSDWKHERCVQQPADYYSTEMDWLRFFWDLRTDLPDADNGESLKPSHTMMLDLWRRIVVEGLDGIASWGKFNTWERADSVANDPGNGMPENFIERWNDVAGENGVAGP